MELSGLRIDAKQYQYFVDQVLQAEEEYSGMPERKVVAFERFKFWLGMPNDYYSSE
jgi:hypothetical protein